MLFNEVDAKLDYFMSGEKLSVKEIFEKRFAELRKNNVSKKGLFLDLDDVLRERDPICSNCSSSKVRKNGYHVSKSALLEKLGFSIKIGQYECLDCGCCWSVDATQLFELLDYFKQEVRKLAVLIRSEKNSLDKTSLLLKKFVGKKYSHTSIKRWYDQQTTNIEEPNDKTFSGYYVYDEQEVKVEGEKKQRLVLRDVTHEQPFAEKVSNDKEKETIRKFLVENLNDKKHVSLTVDGDQSYPSIITEDLKMNYQNDIPHLFKNVTKDFRNECSYGLGRKHLHLMDELKKQEFFDIFYPREELITFVKEGLKKLNKIKDENCKEEKDQELQKKLKKLKYERKKKRRRKNYVHEHKNYTVEEAKKKFEKIKLLKSFYPKPVQARINKIEKEWEHYILFLVDRNVPPTSNLAEQYYSSTLQRSEKKKFRNEETINKFLKIERLKKAGILPILLSGLSFIEILELFLELFLTT